MHLKQALPELRERFEEAKQQKFHFKNMINVQNPIWIFGLVICLLFGAYIIKKIIDNFSNLPVPENAVATGVAIETPVPASFENVASVAPENVDTVQSALRTHARTVNLKKLVNLKINKYKVGMLGGISNAKITVNNQSDYTLDKVTVLIQYLKRNGVVIHQEVLNVHPLHSKAAKVVAVPSHKRGTMIKAVVQSVQSRQYNTALSL